jgi:hypothetical protein
MPRECLQVWAYFTKLFNMAEFRISTDQYERDIDRRVRPDELQSRVGCDRPEWYVLRVIGQISAPERQAYEGLLKVVMISETESGLGVYGYPPELDGKQLTNDDLAYMDSEGFLKDPDMPGHDGYLLDTSSQDGDGDGILVIRKPVFAGIL